MAGARREGEGRGRGGGGREVDVRKGGNKKVLMDALYIVSVCKFY